MCIRDRSNVITMRDMFERCKDFNQPIGKWNVSNVTNMSGMFRQASSFNQPLESWDVSNVSDMSYMFKEALLFKEGNNFFSIAGWNVSNVIKNRHMFDDDVMPSSAVVDDEEVELGPALSVSIAEISPV